MEIYQDFQEFFKSLNKLGVEYVIVGGYAMAFHGVPRATQDIDILLHADKNNARRIVGALQDFGFGTIGFKEDDFQQERFFFRMGRPPQQIDLLTRIPGVNWQQVWDNRIVGEYGDTRVNVINREQFIKAKRASGRIQDLGDIERLGEEV